jgi:hypothetical protein
MKTASQQEVTSILIYLNRHIKDYSKKHGILARSIKINYTDL